MAKDALVQCYVLVKHRTNVQENSILYHFTAFFPCFPILTIFILFAFVCLMVNLEYLNGDTTGALQEWAGLTLHLLLISLLYVCMNACLRSLIYFESQVDVSDGFYGAHLEALKKERAQKAMDSLIKF